MLAKTLKLGTKLAIFLLALGTSTSDIHSQVAAPTLNTPMRSAGDQIQLSLNGFTNFYYTLETSSDLTNWVPVQTNSTLKDAGTANFQLSSTNAQTFFRAKGWGKRYYPLFQGALAVKESIVLDGYNLTSDSYNSMDTNYSSLVTNINFGTNWFYDINKRHDYGDISAILGITNYFNIGNVTIWGKLYTGPLGFVDIGPNGRIGDAAWQNSENGSGEVQPGFVSNTMNTSFPEVTPPSSFGFPLGRGVYNGTVYDYLLAASNVNYVSTTLIISGKLCVTGSNVVLWAKAGLNLSGTGGVFIAPGASVVIYVGDPGSTNPVTADFTGHGGINANGYAKNCQIYGLANCTTIKMSGNGDFVGTLYAPNARMIGSLSGNYTLDLMGAIIVKSVTLKGDWNFHYDEALNFNGPNYSDPNVLGVP